MADVTLDTIEVTAPKQTTPAAPATPVANGQQFTATISARGQIFSAWESVVVKRSFGAKISDFEFVPAEGAYGPGQQQLQLQPGDPVTITLAGYKVIQGRVTDRSVAYDATSHHIVIAGRSQMDSIVKSSIQPQPGGYDGSTFEQAVRSVLQPFGLTLSMQNAPQVASKPFASLYPQYGERVATFIDRLAKMRGLFLIDDENGNLVAANADPKGASVAQLVEGQNILSAVGKMSNQSLYPKHIFSTQQPGTDANWPPRDISATAKNPMLGGAEVNVAIAEHPGDRQDMQARVGHAVARSLWTAVECTITVAGWLAPNGQLWAPIKNVSVQSPMLFPGENGVKLLCIRGVTYQQDSQNGTTTTLDLCLESALSPLAAAGAQDIPASGSSFIDKVNATQPAQPDAPDWQVNMAVG